MRYQDFIGELRDLVKNGEVLRSQSLTHENPKFREWRHRAENLVREALAHNYRLPGTFKSDGRTYRAMYPGASFPANATALEKELGDSLIELRYLIEQFEKYGEPMRTQLIGAADPQPQAAVPAPALAQPEKVTLAWLVKHVSVGFWLKALSLALGILLLGAAIGRAQTFASFVTWLKNNWPF